MDIDKLISKIRILKEEPTVNVGSGHIAGTAPAGDDPPVFKKKYNYRKNYAKGGRGSRKWWLQFLKGN